MVHLEIKKDTYVRLLKLQEMMERTEKTHQQALGMQGAVLLPYDTVLTRCFNAWEQLAGVN